MASNHLDPDFHPGESAAQNQWNTSGQWDEQRREQLLWKEIPVELQARFEQVAS